MVRYQPRLLALLLAVLLLAPLAAWPAGPAGAQGLSPAQAAITITVTTPADQWDTNPATAPSSKCSLREALQATGSNSLGNQGCGTINPNNPAYIISLPPGTYLLTQQEEMPNINKQIYINGNNAVTIDGNKGSRPYGIFIVAGGELILEELTLQNGKRPFGGAIWIKYGTARVTAVDFRKNVADNGPTIGRGGAVAVDTGAFECVAGKFIENEARDAGGAISSGSAAVKIDNCEFLRNQAGVNGGAFASTGGSFVTHPYIYQSLFRENFVKQTVTPAGWPAQYSFEQDASGGGAIHTTAYMRLEQVEFVKNYTERSKGGGAIYNQGEIELVDSAITDSKAKSGGPVPATIGGAILNDSKLTLRRTSIHYNEATYGGAILNRTSGQLIVLNSTIAENLATTYGGIANGYNFPLSGNTAFNQGGTVTLLHATVAGNNDDSGDADGSPNIANVNNGTIIVGNSLTDAPCFGTLTTHGGNVFVKSCTRISSDQFTDHSLADVVAPGKGALKLAGLSNNGGVSLPEAEFLSLKTDTNSPGVDLAREAWCNDPALPAEYELASDQANVGRPIGPRCDSGALEIGTNPPKAALFWNENPVSKLIAFGLVLLDAQGYSDGTLKVKNDGGGSFGWAVAFAGNDQGVYSLQEGPSSGSLGQGQVATLRLRCAAKSLGWQQPARLILTTDAPGSEQLSLLLECKGTTWDEDKAIAFEDTQSGPLSAGAAAPGGQSQTQVAVSNPSPNPLAATVQWQQPAANSPLAFATTLPASLPAQGLALAQAELSVPPQGKLTITITCSPTAPGLFTNTLLVATSDPQTPLLTYAVACEGAPPPEPDPLALGNFYQQLPGAEVMGLALAPDGTQLLAGEWGTARVLNYRIADPASGQLSYQGEFSAPGMGTITGIRYSADGKHVYYTSSAGNGVVAVGRSPGGGLSLIDTVTADDQLLCGVNPLKFCLRDRMRGARALDISPDDTTLYVTGIGDDTLTVLRRNAADGKLSVTQSFTGTFAGLPNLMLEPFGVVVSPDGRNVYVAARGSDSVIAFSRNPLNGRLSYLTHVRDESGGATGLDGATELNLSPDGRFLYVAGQYDDAVQILQRSPADGFIAPVESVLVGDAPYHLLTSHDPDGARLVVALYTGDAVKVYQRDRVSGKLTPLAAQPGLPMNDAVFLVASPDDQHVYVALYAGKGVRHLRASRYAPLATSLAPAAVVAGSPDLTLTVSGSRFYPDSAVTWNGAPLATTFVSSRKLEAAVPAALLASAGTASVAVRTGPVGGGDAAALSLALTASGAPPLPAISGLSPEEAPADGEPLEVTVSGAGFTPQSQVLLNGNPVATTYLNEATLLALLAADDVDAPGPLALTVVNQAPAAPAIAAAGTGSAPVRFALAPLDTAALPAISRFEPGSLAAGGEEQWLTVRGFNFSVQPGARSVAAWNGAARETVVLDAGTLQLRLSASDLGAAGTGMVTVSTPGAGSSDGRSISVLPPGQSPVAQLDLARIEAGAAPQLVLSGAGFVDGAEVRINGVARATTFVNPYVLVATLTRADVRAGGVVRVANPGAAASNAVLLTPAPAQFLPFVWK